MRTTSTRNRSRAARGIRRTNFGDARVARRSQGDARRALLVRATARRFRFGTACVELAILRLTAGLVERNARRVCHEECGTIADEPTDPADASVDRDATVGRLAEDLTRWVARIVDTGRRDGRIENAQGAIRQRRRALRCHRSIATRSPAALSIARLNALVTSNDVAIAAERDRTGARRPRTASLETRARVGAIRAAKLAWTVDARATRNDRCACQSNNRETPPLALHFHFESPSLKVAPALLRRPPLLENANWEVEAILAPCCNIQYEFAHFGVSQTRRAQSAQMRRSGRPVSSRRTNRPHFQTPQRVRGAKEVHSA